MNGETGKRRKSRIELKYYQTADWYLWWRRGLCLFAICAVAIWIVKSAIASRRATSHSWLPVPTTIASKGPLSQPHAIWDSACDACHVSFASINGSRWSPAAGQVKTREARSAPPAMPGRSITRIRKAPRPIALSVIATTAAAIRLSWPWTTRHAQPVTRNSLIIATGLPWFRTSPTA